MTRTKPRTARGTSRGRGRRKDHTMTDDDRAERDFARNLFTPEPPEPEPEPERASSNHVPREGNTPTSRPTSEEATREWARELFGHPGIQTV